MAGAPLVNDVLACHLVAVDTGSYGVSLSDEQGARLRRIFPEGVCDWSRSGIGQQAAISPLTFSAGPGGQPLPPAPVSTKK